MRFKLHPKILEKMNTLKATWLNIITYGLSFKAIVYEMCLGVCFVLFLIFQEENKCCRNCWTFAKYFHILQDWDKRHHTEFQLLQSWKTQGSLYRLGFDLVFVSEMSRLEYVNYAEYSNI